MRKKLLALALAFCLLWGCQAPSAHPKVTVYEASFLTLFDTVTTLKGAAQSQEAFTLIANSARDQLEYYHQLFDIYNNYPGLNNLKTVNDQAGIAPVTVDPAILDLLTDCLQYYELTGGRVNVAMGSVLALWHQARSEGRNDPANAKLPAMEKLEAAAAHTDISCLMIDRDNSTVYLSDPLARLDVGAVAKGWSAQRVAQQLPEGILLSVGGNVCATGQKQENTPWVIGIEDPDSDAYVHTLYVSGGCVVTSGDYQRAYAVDGKLYHHIIDPDTLMPSTHWRSVTVICQDSGLADALSTALFLLPLEAGQALAQQSGAQALWLDAKGQEFMTPGFRELIKT